MIAHWILLLGLWAAAPGQPGPEVADFFLDPVGKAYYLLDDDRFVTDNRLGDTRYSFYDSSLGSPDYIDVTNPFQILIYYRQYGTVVILDRTLSELDRIDLFAREDLRQPGAIARSYDNGIWVFDNWDYRLVRLSEEGRIDQQSNNLRLELGVASDPSAIFVDRQAVMLYFPGENRLAVFTNYGKFERWITVPGGARLSWYAPRLLGVDEDARTWMWSPQLREVQPIGPLPETLAAARRILAGPGVYLSVDPATYALDATDFPEKS